MARVHDIYEYPDGKFIYLNFSGWNWRYNIEFPFDIIPPEWRDTIDIGSRIFCYVNLGADKPEDLKIGSWESFETKEEFDRIVKEAREKYGLWWPYVY